MILTEQSSCNEIELCYLPLKQQEQAPLTQDWALENNTKCVTTDIPHAPLICLDLWCKAGSSYEEEGLEGAAHFLEHLVFKGSISLEAGEFDRRIEALGGSSNAATGFDDVHFHVLTPPELIEPALELLIELVLRPALRVEEFSTEREVVLEEIAQYKDQPDDQIFQRILENCWSNHSYGRPILGYEDSLKTMTPDELRSFHQRRYQGVNTCISIAGPITNRIKSLLENSYLNSIPNFKTEGIKKIEMPLFKQGHKHIKVPRLESSRILMAWPLPPASDQLKNMGADIGTSLLAEGRSSILVNHLREELQIVESIDMEVTNLEKGGLILLEACCSEENINRVEKEIANILRQSLENQPTKKQLNRAKQLVRNSLYFSLESSSQVASLTGSQTLWDRSQPLLKPIELIDLWTDTLLQTEIFNLMQPEKSFTLIATPQNQ